MTHFIKDTYRDNPFWIFTGWKAGYHSVKLNLLHDIALLLYKYEEVFDWQKFYETAREFNQIIPAYYMIQFLKEIYGLTVPDDIEKKLYDSFPQSRTFMETVLASCGERKVSEILFLDQYEVMRDILPGMCFKGEVSGDDYVKEFYIKGPGNRLKNLEDSRTLVSYSEYAKGRICIKEDALLFSVRIFGGEKYAPYYPSITIQAGDGSIIPKYQCVTPRIQFIAERTGDGMRSRLFVGMDEYLAGNESDVCSMEGDLVINLVIDQEILPIKYGGKMLFNVEIDERNELGDNIRSAGVYMASYNIVNYACFNIINSDIKV